MGWAVGEFQGRDIGYGVPAVCDHPGCDEQIDRGLGYVCGWGHPYGGDEGCGLFFCPAHGGGTLCQRCDVDAPSFDPSPDTDEWRQHKLTHPSWQRWRDENPHAVARMRSVKHDHSVPPETNQDVKP